jgi:hypothetical protein
VNNLKFLSDQDTMKKLEQLGFKGIEYVRNIHIANRAFDGMNYEQIADTLTGLVKAFESASIEPESYIYLVLTARVKRAIEIVKVTLLNLNKDIVENEQNIKQNKDNLLTIWKSRNMEYRIYKEKLESALNLC